MAACGADGLSSACALAIRLKYSKARKSSCATPSPSAYIRPSFHCATGWPPSAAYCSEVREVAVAADGTAFFKAWAVPGCAATTGMAVSCGPTGVPSKAAAGATCRAPAVNATMVHSNIRITLLLARTTWVGHGTIHRGSDLLGVLPQRT